MIITIAIDSFKGSLSSAAAGKAAARGIQRVFERLVQHTPLYAVGRAAFFCVARAPDNLAEAAFGAHCGKQRPERGVGVNDF